MGSVTDDRRTAGVPLIGRDQELREVLRRLRGPGEAVVIEGEAGIGKSALWRAAIAELAAHGCVLLTGRTSEAEAKLSFVTLADLLAPVLDELLGTLAGPPRRALEVALLRAEAGPVPPDPRAIGLGVLEGLRALAAGAPVVVAIDDVQWLDGASANVLGFALRRLEAEPVGLLATRRLEGGVAAVGPVDRLLGRDRVWHLKLGPLSLAGTHELISAHLGINLTRELTVRLHDACAGNAFFALEIGRELTARRGADDAAGTIAPGSPAPLPVTDSVRVLVARRLGRLPARTRRALLFAAALSRPTLATLRRLDPEVDDLLAPALRAGIVELAGERLRFAHPLLATVPYGDATPGQRRRVHAQLAAVLDDPEERAHHQALAATGPSHPISRSLMAAARAARARGAPVAAADLAERAVALTPPSSGSTRTQRLLTAAELNFQAGRLGRCLELTQRLLALRLSPRERAVALLLLGAARGEADSVPAAIEVYTGALRDGGGDARQRAELHGRLAWNTLVHRGALDAHEHAERALRVAEGLGDDAALAIALATEALVRVVRGRSLDGAAIARARALEKAARERGHWIWPDESPTVVHGVALLWRGDLEEAEPLLRDARQVVGERGDAISEAVILHYLSPLLTRAGELRRGHALALEARELTESAPGSAGSGSLFVHAHAAAPLGLSQETRAAAAAGLERSRRQGNAYFEIGCLAALASLALSEERFGDAVDALDRAAALQGRLGIEAPGLFLLGPDRVRALVAVDRVDDAADAARLWRTRAEACGRPWALALAHRCDGIVLGARGRHEEAVAAFELALAEHDRQPRPLERARSSLALGAELRHARRKRAAREALMEARDGFHACGAAQWERRADHELRRIGGRPASSTAGALSATETSIVQLVAEGHTNSEVGALLHLSPKTVEWNLSRVYRKLGVRSRTQLAAALGPGGAAPRSTGRSDQRRD